MRGGFWASGLVLVAVLAGCSAPAQDVPVPLYSGAVPASVARQPEPARVVVPAIGVDGSLIPLGVDASGGTEEPPVEKPELGSWYEPGPRPGENGPAVILGHVNGGGKQGIFARLKDLKVGDKVTIKRVDGTEVHFEIYRTATIDKKSFPTQDVYGNTAGPEIRLITCGGTLDRANHRYLSNVMVWGKLVN